VIRVCMVVYKFPPLYGGAGRQALRLAGHLKRRGISVLILDRPRAKRTSPLRDPRREFLSCVSPFSGSAECAR